MKTLKKAILTLALLFGLAIGASAQSRYNTGRYYAYQGQSTTQTSYQNEYNAYCNCYVTVRYCRQLNWYQEWHSGYIYYWNSYTGQWYSEWKQGTFWYCTWSGWYRC